MTLFDVTNSVLAAIVLARAINYANSMNGKTRHLLRSAVVLLAVASFGITVAPLFVHVPQWLNTLFVLAVALYFAADKRSPLKAQHG